MELTQFDTMTEQEIIEQARQRGYSVRDAPAHYATPGKRIGGSKVTTGADKWMNAANVRLWESQTGRKV